MVGKVLVIGSEGTLGKTLMDVLKADSIDVVGADILSLDNKVDITKKDEVDTLIESVKPEIVILTAAYTDVDGCEKDIEHAFSVNQKGPENVAAACKESNIKLLYISTDFVFDGSKKAPYTENDNPNPLNIYATSKLKGEEAIRRLLDRYLVVRTSWLFGKQGKNFVDTIIDKAKLEDRFKVVSDQVGSPTYALDLAHAIAELISVEDIFNAKTVNISNTGSCSWYEFAKEALHLKGVDTAKLIPATTEEISRPALRPKYSVLDNSYFNKITQKPLPSWQDALKRYLN